MYHTLEHALLDLLIINALDKALIPISDEARVPWAKVKKGRLTRNFLFLKVLLKEKRKLLIILL